MKDELRRMALFGSGIAELTVNRAERIVRDLVGAGDVGRKQASTVVRDLLEASRQNRTELMRFVRAEVANQTENLGLATKRDLDRLERRIARLEAAAAEAKSARAKTTRKATGKKSAGRKGTRRAPIRTRPAAESRNE
jgi:polyhydroxyalkanoate synthesis regulator phasin